MKPILRGGNQLREMPGLSWGHRAIKLRKQDPKSSLSGSKAIVANTLIYTGEFFYIRTPTLQFQVPVPDSVFSLAIALAREA